MFTITNARPFAISTQCGCVARCTPNAQFNFTFYIRTTEHLFFAFLIISYLQILSTLFHKIFKFLFFVYSSKVFDTWAKKRKNESKVKLPYSLANSFYSAYFEGKKCVLIFISSWQFPYFIKPVYFFIVTAGSSTIN